ncbi:MAG TPA: hypothetical protein VGO73_01330 [Pyrinomonadaceae bacterium]|jgi:hypothetical protein|nr:hypothetical protein [Pyrinomonadaceae bacterium]
MNTNARSSERGGARLKFLIVITIIAAVAYAGYQFIPVAYQSYQLKDLMQHDVDTAVAMGKPASWVKDQLVKNSTDYGIPADAVISPQQQDNRMEVRVQFTQPIEFPGFTYSYEFDHTAKSGTFLSIK